MANWKITQARLPLDHCPSKYMDKAKRLQTDSPTISVSIPEVCPVCRGQIEISNRYGISSASSNCGHGWSYGKWWEFYFETLDERFSSNNFAEQKA